MNCFDNRKCVVNYVDDIFGCGCLNCQMSLFHFLMLLLLNKEVFSFSLCC